MYNGDFNFQILGISKKRGVPLRVLGNDIWKTGSVQNRKTAGRFKICFINPFCVCK